MKTLSDRAAIAALPLFAALSGCTSLGDAGHSGGLAVPSGPSCATSQVVLAFDFPGASPARCVIEGERSFALVIAPEHAPPINPSPWYAFRYTARSDGPVTVRLDYLDAKHRYAPKLTRAGVVSALPVSVADNGKSALVTLPAGSGTVSAQPIQADDHYADFAGELVREYGGERIALGRSHDGNVIEAIRFGAASAPRTIVILGRQHPPEVTGSYALEPFVQTLARRWQHDPQIGRSFQILAVPLLNPDGVARGHWRANRGGIDLNRDWGPFSQPETRAVRDWLARQSATTTPVAMIDFHSTWRNLFYVQGDEAGDANQRFLTNWLAGKEQRFPGYSFTIERRNANPGSGTAKNWFFECYAIPAYTYEVGDDTNALESAAAARTLADGFVESLPILSATRAAEDGAASCLPAAGAPVGE